MGRPRKTEAQHELEGSLYQHRYYLKRKAGKGEPEPADPKLVKEAEIHGQLWIFGFDRYGLLEDFDKARELWEVVREQYMDSFKVGSIDNFGNVTYLPSGYWLFDCPDAPFCCEEIEGLPPGRSLEYWQHQALIEWGMLPPDTPAQGLINRAAECERLYQRKMAGNDNFLPFCYGTTEAEMSAKWAEIKAERAAWVKLGIINDGRTNDRQRITKDND